MKKHFKWLRKNGRLLLLQRSIGLFGEHWECFGDFDDKESNLERGKLIVKQLNDCANNTDKYNKND